MKRTALHETHRRLGASLVEFAGWEMPVSYAGILPEAQAVRTAAGLFDVSHMGIIELRGTGARRDAERLLSCAIAPLSAGRARYGLLLNPAGGILDDVLVYSLDADRLWIVANAANADRVYHWIQQHAESDTSVVPHFGSLAILALQGPTALGVATEATGKDFTHLRRYAFATWGPGSGEGLVSRTGYTGEDGLEFFCPSVDAPALWERLLEAGREHGLVPCGLGARDVLRIEAGNVLYGHEIDETTTPVEANLMLAVDLSEAKGDFVGRESIERALTQPLERALVGVVMEERAIPRQGATVGVKDRAVGRVTSGTFSPTLGRAIGLAYVRSEASAPEQAVWVELRGQRRRGRVARLPFYRRP